MSAGHVLLPLYIYPTAVDWAGVYGNITANPTLNFSIIINPSSGPGSCPGQRASQTCYPTSDYVDAISQLNSYSNTQLFGYVDTAVTGIPISTVQKQILTYHKWANYNADHPQLAKADQRDIHMDGIFFDDCAYDHNKKNFKYMQQLSNYAKSTMGPGFQHLIFNPGTTPDPQYFQYADEIVVFESYYSYGSDRYTDDTLKQTPSQFWPKSSFLIHNFDGTLAEMNSVVENLIGNGIQGLYISTTGDTPTDPDDDPSGIYDNMSSYWTQFCDYMW